MDSKPTCDHCFQWGFTECRCHKGAHLIEVQRIATTEAAAWGMGREWQLFQPRKADA